MILRAALATVLLLISACGQNGGQPLHPPDWSLAKAADSSDSDSNLFSSYNPSGPVRWNQGWPWKFDLSGVAWDQSRTATAITPRHVVMAAHYTRGAGKPLVFHDREGRPHRRTIIREMSLRDAGIHGDIAIGLLDRPLPSSIRTYPLPEPRSDHYECLLGAQVLVTEQKRRLFFHRVAHVSKQFIRFRYDDRLPTSRRTKLIGGDSGNPSFILSHGELVLIETHTGGGSGTGPFYGSTELQGSLRKIVAELDSDHSIRTVRLDSKVLKDAETGRAGLPQANPPAATTPAPRAPAAPPSKSPRARNPRPAAE